MLYHCQSHPSVCVFILCLIKKAPSGFVSSGLSDKSILWSIWKPLCLPPEWETDKNLAPSLLPPSWSIIYWGSLCENNHFVPLPKPSHCTSFLFCLMRKASFGFIRSGLYEKVIVCSIWKPFCLPPERETYTNVAPHLLRPSGHSIYWGSLCGNNHFATLPKPSHCMYFHSLST